MLYNGLKGAVVTRLLLEVFPKVDKLCAAIVQNSLKLDRFRSYLIRMLALRGRRLFIFLIGSERGSPGNKCDGLTAVNFLY